MIYRAESAVKIYCDRFALYYIIKQKKFYKHRDTTDREIRSYFNLKIYTKVVGHDEEDEDNIENINVICRLNLFAAKNRMMFRDCEIYTNIVGIKSESLLETLTVDLVPLNLNIIIPPKYESDLHLLVLSKRIEPLRCELYIDSLIMLSALAVALLGITAAALRA